MANQSRPDSVWLYRMWLLRQPGCEWVSLGSSISLSRVNNQRKGQNSLCPHTFDTILSQEAFPEHLIRQEPWGL